MRTAALHLPGVATGFYPERDPRDRSAPNPLAALVPGHWTRRGHARFAQRVIAQEGALRALSDDTLRLQVRALRARLSVDDSDDRALVDAFALVREMSRRQLGMAHFSTQIVAARILLAGRLAEMQTGEGKTLAAALTAATGALAGVPVHVITANDYLVARDAELLGPLYRALGLTVGHITQPMPADQRRAAYACDITYCTAKELVFDYLRDGLIRRKRGSDLQQRIGSLEGRQSAGSQLLLRGLWMALIDEADSILIDEARTPLILSQTRVNAQQSKYALQALRIAARLRSGEHFSSREQRIELTPVAQELLEQIARGLGGLWADYRHREELVAQALAAHHLYRRDRHYLVQNGRVVMIDQNTGRVAPGRVWSRGLHQMLEIKEGCTLTGDQETIAQITYQRFFPRYLRLCGMSGTLSEAAGELRSVYALAIERVPLRTPSRRSYFPVRMYAKREAKWKAVVERAAKLQKDGRPVLIGTDSVADSESLAKRLHLLGLPHVVLNARHHREEAATVARAGEAGRITVTTNMAGRGTDIPLAPGVAERGGLHVICCQHNSSRRIDRQLHGRCARQGDPGSVETILSLDDGLIARRLPRPVRDLPASIAANRPLPGWLGAVFAWLPQRMEERRQRAERRALQEQDAQIERRLSFAGRGE